MNRERRLARPFAGLSPSLTEALDGTALRFGDRTVPADARLQWEDPDRYGEQDIFLAWCPPGRMSDFRANLRRGCSESSLPPDSLALVVTATSRYLGFVDVLVVHSLDDLDELEPEMDLRAEKPDAAAWRTSTRGCRVDAYLLLSRALHEEPLRPWRKGVWLSRAGFTVATDYTESLFRPRRLDDRARTRFGLSAQVMRYVRLPDNIWDEYEADDPPEAYLDAEIMDEIAARPRALASRIAQVELVQVFLHSVLADACLNREHWKDREWPEIEKSLLGKVLRAICGKGASAKECAHRMDELAGGHLERVVAESEGATEIRSLLHDALRGAD